MERLTKTFQKAGEKFACLPECEVECVYGWAKENSGCRCDKFAKILNRLSAIEDILGDDYDLNRLKELLDADKENRLDIFSNEESIVRIFCPKDEDGLYIKQVAGVISEKEYMAEHGRRAEVR